MSNIESLDSDELVTWLDQAMKEKNVELNQSQRTKFRSEQVIGAVFLILSESDLKELGLTIGQRKIILDVIEKLKQDAEPPKEPLKPDLEQPPTLCSTDLMIPAGTSNASGTFGLAAWAPGDKIWKRRSTLKVLFMQDVPVRWKIDGRSLTHRTILQRANTWNDIEPSIPKFIEADSLDDSDIRVKFYTIDEESGNRVYGQTWSELGTDAAKSKEKATMYLDLSHQDDNYKKHVIVHEFGHALGLEHEHQRSEFWDIAGSFIQTKKMFESIKKKSRATLTYDQFTSQWGVNKIPGSEIEYRYDPDSVMHYWFDVNWLDDHYKDPAVFENDPSLSEVAKKVLRGICKRPEDLPIVPSVGDISFLRDKYIRAKAAKSSEHDMSTRPGQQSGIVAQSMNVQRVSDRDWFDICEYLRKLDTYKIKLLGGQLGLNVFRINNMEYIPGDMVMAWLRKEDRVKEKSGDPLTWNVLIEKLRGLGHAAIADEIMKDKI